MLFAIIHAGSIATRPPPSGDTLNGSAAARQTSTASAILG
jgi:hypothetical protein